MYLFESAIIGILDASISKTIFMMTVMEIIRGWQRSTRPLAWLLFCVPTSDLTDELNLYHTETNDTTAQVEARQ